MASSSNSSAFRICLWWEVEYSTQIEVVCGQIACRAVGRPRGLGRLQRRLDDAGDADRDLRLQFEHVFERAVEAVGP